MCKPCGALAGNLIPLVFFERCHLQWRISWGRENLYHHHRLRTTRLTHRHRKADHRLDDGEKLFLLTVKPNFPFKRCPTRIRLYRKDSLTEPQQPKANIMAPRGITKWSSDTPANYPTNLEGGPRQHLSLERSRCQERGGSYLLPCL